MRLLSELLFRLRALIHRDAWEEELSEELRFHLEKEEEKLRSEGLSPEDARREARIRFGGEERFREQARDSWGVRPLQDMGGDVRYALRQLRKHLAFGTMGVLTLALGIGGTVALFSVVNALVLRPLPIADEDRLVTFWADYDWRGVEFDHLRERTTIFEGVAAYTDDATTFGADAGARLMLYSLGSAELFDVLGVRPELGRTFQAGDDRPGAEPVIVLSHGLWTREFGGSLDVLGRRVDFGGQRRTVVGVMPEGFYFPSPESEAWVPLNLDPDDSVYANAGWLVLTGRLRGGLGDADIEAELGRFGTTLADRFDYPEAWDKSRHPYFTPTREFLVGDVRPLLVLLLGAVGLVLLIACVNVAALILTRTMDRTGEMGVRAALGAGRVRLARQVLTESVVLGLIAAVVGTGLAVAAFDVLVASLPLPRELGRTIELEWQVLGMGIVLALVAGCAISLVPVRALLKGDLSGAVLGQRSQSGGTHARRRTQKVLVAAEVSLAVVLATGAALLVRTVDELRAIDLGVDPDGVMTIELIAPESGGSAEERAAVHATALEQARALPGVEAAGLVFRVPVRDGGWQGPVSPTDQGADGDFSPNAYFRPMSPGAFDVLRIEVVEGRPIRVSDSASDAPVAVVNETFARTVFPGQNALGRTFESGGFASDPIEVVGVIRDVPVDDLVGDVPSVAYYPWDQAARGTSSAILVLRTGLEPTDLVEPVRRIVNQADARVAIGRTESMEAIVDAAMIEPLRLRFFLGLFSLLGLVLGTVGVYGVVSYAVQRRRAEFGIRLALGAAPDNLLGSVVRDGMLPVVVGIVLGGIVALVTSTSLASFLFGVRPTDPVSMGAASATLLLAGLLAALLPAWRASVTDPAEALRAD